VDQHTAGHRISSPGFSGLGRVWDIIADSAKRFADEPEFTITAYLAPVYAANFFSKARTLSCKVNWPFIIGSIMKTTSSASYVSAISGNWTL